jgi:hypothetical protein
MAIVTKNPNGRRELYKVSNRRQKPFAGRLKKMGPPKRSLKLSMRLKEGMRGPLAQKSRSSSSPKKTKKSSTVTIETLAVAGSYLEQIFQVFAHPGFQYRRPMLRPDKKGVNNI